MKKWWNDVFERTKRKNNWMTDSKRIEFILFRNSYVIFNNYLIKNTQLLMHQHIRVEEVSIQFIRAKTFDEVSMRKRYELCIFHNLNYSSASSILLEYNSHSWVKISDFTRSTNSFQWRISIRMINDCRVICLHVSTTNCTQELFDDLIHKQIWLHINDCSQYVKII
jgi:hypothetical protein